MSTGDERYVVVTGASSGIGEGFAREFAARGEHVILVARREHRLHEIGDSIRRKGVKVECVPFDLFQIDSAEKLAALIRSRGWEVKGLVNNAGLGYQKNLLQLSKEQIDRMLTVNLISLTQLAREMIPAMVERGDGFVLNVASVAGFLPLAHFSVYAATKAYVLSLSQALHHEVREKGVRVVCLCPGPVHTEFQKVAAMEPRFFASAQQVEEVVAAGMRALAVNRAVAWTSWCQRIATFFIDLTPRPIRRWMGAKALELSGFRGE